MRSIRSIGEVTKMAEKKITPKEPTNAKDPAEKAATRVTKERSMRRRLQKKKAMRKGLE